jgi:DNA-binding response OmpR family regulator
VEDEAAVRTLTRRALEAQGYVVLTAENGAAGLRMAQEHEKPIHLLVTDVVMPDMSGPELARQIAIRWPEMKVIFVSGYPGEAIAHRGVLEPGVPFVQKPFAIRDLAQKVREVLDGSAR